MVIHVRFWVYLLGVNLTHKFGVSDLVMLVLRHVQISNELE